MQAQLDKAVADADAKREAQQKAFEAQDSNDPAAQLQGLMNAQQSLKRLTSAFSNKPNLDKVTDMAKKLGIPMTPELMQLGNNEAISNALVEIAVGMGKSEQEISAALGSDWVSSWSARRLILQEKWNITALEGALRNT